MSNRIDETMKRLRESKRKAFVAYITAGDPNLQKTVELVPALAEAGVDIIELGLPFSDPLADGVVIQLAAQRALEAGTSVNGVLDAVREIRKKTQVPIVAFTYLNPIYRYGMEKFYREAAVAGIDGVLVLDLPPEEAKPFQQSVADSGMRNIWLIAPTTPPDRVKTLAKLTSGFVYYVSREGVTGMQETIATTIGDQVAAIRKHTDVPICVGFGISNPEQAASVAALADGSVVGSAIVKKIGEFGSSPDFIQKITAFVKPIADAVHRA